MNPPASAAGLSRLLSGSKGTPSPVASSDELAELRNHAVELTRDTPAAPVVEPPKEPVVPTWQAGAQK